MYLSPAYNEIELAMKENDFLLHYSQSQNQNKQNFILRASINPKLNTLDGDGMFCTDD
jgi:hypothetical protein